MFREIRYFIVTMRPYQWIKNSVLFAPLIFSRNIFILPMMIKAVAAFCLFCSCSGCVYIMNDLVDVEHDRKHPLKSSRPLASGQLKRTVAIGGGIGLGLVSIGLAWRLSLSFLIIMISYFALQVMYSYFLKKIVILDVFAIASGFMLRVIAGAEVIQVPLSSWLFICTILLSLFLALSKRRHELVFLEKEAILHRKTLEEYSPYLLDQMISVVTPATVVAYALYTVAPETIQKFNTSRLLYTVPFVLYGILRYLYLIHQKNEGGRPERILMTDKPLLINIIAYGLTVIIILYIL